MNALKDYSRLCIHTITTDPWTLRECLDNYALAEVPAISIWQKHLHGAGLAEATKMLRDSPLKVSGLCQSGVFTATSGAARETARTDTRRAIDEAAEIGAKMLVITGGAVPGMELSVARQQIADGLVAVLPHAKSAGITLAFEPLHPMYADSGSAINTLDQGNNLLFALQTEQVGLVIDTYHCWWDPFLRAEIDRASKSLAALHIADWRTPTRTVDGDRTLPGLGCINNRQIRGWMEKAGFNGWIEVEIQSNDFWEQNPEHWLRRIKNCYLKHA